MDDITKGKTNAILAYCTPIGWIIGFILHNNDKSRFAAFHLRQGLGVMCLGLALTFISVFFIAFWMPFVFLPVRWLINLCILALAIIGIINANNGKTTPLPLVGPFFEKIFSGLN